jgi:N-acetylneuraminic acid mutarotase
MKNFTILKLFTLLFSTAIFLQVSAQSPYTKLKSVGNPRDGAIMFAIGTKIYMGGGSSNDFWVYDTYDGSLKQLPNIPGVKTNRSFGVGFAVNGMGYAGMGFDGSNDLKTDLWQYDPSANTWSQKASRPGIGMDAMGVFVIGHKAYMGGGTDNQNIYGNFYEYDAAADKWTIKSNLPTGAAAFPAFFAINNKGYFTTGDAGGGSEITATYQYDTTTDTWATKADFPGGGRQTCVSFVVNNKAYVGLGQSKYTKAFSDMYVYDPATDNWSKINSFTGGNRCWASAASTSVKGYIGFGWDLASTFYNDFYSFDPTTATGIARVNTTYNNLQIFPNPASGQIQITLSGKEIAGQINIRDMQGRILYSITPGSNQKEFTLPLLNFKKGLYIFEVQGKDGSAQQKFVVQ